MLPNDIPVPCDNYSDQYSDRSYQPVPEAPVVTGSIGVAPGYYGGPRAYYDGGYYDRPYYHRHSRHYGPRYYGGPSVGVSFGFGGGYGNCWGDPWHNPYC